MGLFPHLDYYEFSKDLDHVSWDNYPITEKFDEIHYHSACAADLMRGVKRKNFWIMEQTVGPHGWGTFGRNVRPGEIFKISMQQIAHGADHIMWFRWRSCTAGREQYWHGVLGHDGKPLRRYREVKDAAAKFQKLWPELEGTTLKSKVAIIMDYDSRWAMTFQPSYNGNDGNYLPAIRRYYDALLRAGVNVDMIQPGQDLTGYKVVLAPHLYIMPDDLAKRLDAFVRAGGVLVSDCRTGVKDPTSLCHDRTLPGLLADCLGIAIEEYESLNSIEYPAVGTGTLAGNWTAILFADWIKAKGAEVLATMQPWHVKGFPLATKNRYGKGLGYYLASPVKEPAFYDALIGEVLKSAGIKPLVTPPAGVEVTLREGKGRRLLFLVNHLEEEREVTVPAGAKDVLTGRSVLAALKLGAYGCAVLKL
jgi:beta-galactosidase